MSLFKILKGSSERISTTVTPFHDGWCYFCADDGGFYIDSEDNGVKKRTRINDGVPKNQGTSNAGKVLGIGADGNVTPVNALTSGAALTWGDLNGANQGG